MTNIKVPNIRTYTPNQCTEITETVFSTVKQTDGTYSTQVMQVQDGKIVSCAQVLGITTAALAKTNIHLYTDNYIDTL